MKKLLLALLLALALCALVACGEEVNEPEVATPVVAPAEDVTPEVDVTSDVDVPKSEQVGTAGSNIPLKDNNDQAVYEITLAMQEWLRETYGEQIFDARIYVEKIYSYEEEQAIDALKDLGTDKLAFDVHYEIKPAQGVDPNIFLAGSGTYDEESGWVKEKYNSAILVPNESGDPAYKITNMVTGW